MCAVQVAKNSDVLFVSVKPQYVHQVLSEARSSITDTTLVISIAAGITGELNIRKLELHRDINLWFWLALPLLSLSWAQLGVVANPAIDQARS